jgi:cobalamin biosynthesis protein CobW
MTAHARGRIPATIFTGFLGAGKTTLIRALLREAGERGRRIALIVNEFGSLGFDGGLLTECAEPACAAGDIVELTNGCLCCTVADDFLPAMEKLLDRPLPPDHILIETSGLALPQPLLTAFGWPSIKPQVTVDGVVAVVDGLAVARGLFAGDPAAVEAQRRADEALDHDSPLEELFEDQLGAADLVVLTKTDLLDPRQQSDVRAEIRRRARVAVPILAVTRGDVRMEALLGQGAAAEDDIFARRGRHGGPGEEHDHDDFASFVVRPPAFATDAAARAALAAALAAPEVLRVKGRVVVAGRPAPLVIQGVGPRVDTWYDLPGAAADGLVVIGLKTMEVGAIETALTGGVALADTDRDTAAAAAQAA